MLLLRPAHKFIFMAQIVLISLLLGTSLYAGNSPAAISAPNSKIINQQQNAVRTDADIWLRLVSIDNLHRLQLGEAVMSMGSRGDVTIDPGGAYRKQILLFEN